MNSSRKYQRKDYYELLGVERSAGKKEIRRAYAKVAKGFHPDACASVLGVSESYKLEMFEKITSAFNTLVNEDSRADYDKALELSTGDSNELFVYVDPQLYMLAILRDQAESNSRRPEKTAQVSMSGLHQRLLQSNSQAKEHLRLVEKRLEESKPDKPRSIFDKKSMFRLFGIGIVATVLLIALCF